MQSLYPLGDHVGMIRLVDSMGDDLTVVNDARVSYEKESLELNDKDKSLIYYLLKNKHYSPLRGVVFKFEVVAPLFVCRQWWKHSVASSYTDDQRSWNEQSYRYTEGKNQFYIPDMRSQSTKNKQSSEGIVPDHEEAKRVYENQCLVAFQTYQELLEMGVAREIARGILPATIYTRFRWTVSLQGLLYFLELRLDGGAQTEIRKYALAIKSLVTPIVPCVMGVFTNVSD